MNVDPIWSIMDANLAIKFSLIGGAPSDTAAIAMKNTAGNPVSPRDRTDCCLLLEEDCSVEATWCERTIE